MTTFPMRQIHLDFHTSPDIPDVGADFDPEAFARTLDAARVNSVTLFATCHHGMSYYPSKVAPVHPALSFDLLGRQIEACRRWGIRCPVYLTVAWNVSAAERHPEWRQVDINGKQVGGWPVEASWPWLCTNNGYSDELLAQTEELIELYRPDGFFYDIVMIHADGCVCVNCMRDLKASGLDWRNAEDRRKNNHAVARRFMRRMYGRIKEKLPEANVFFNSRWGLHFVDESDVYTQVEVESLPTGGWGYGFYPFWSRYARMFGKPMLGMTGRFHRTWADWGGLKHPAALQFECGGILANGGAVSIGDQLHPRGRLSPAVYEVIGEAFKDVEKVEPYCIGAEPVTQIGLLVLEPGADKANFVSAGIRANPMQGAEGAAKILLELHQQFDVISDRICPDFSRYEMLVVPDRAAPTPETVARLREYVAKGGKLLLSHHALASQLADLIGVELLGDSDSDPDYFTIDAPELVGPVTRAGFAYCLYDGPSIKARALEGTETLCSAHPTYFDRTPDHFTSHGFTPPGWTPENAGGDSYPAVTRHGGVTWIWGPLFGAYLRYGNLTFRGVVDGLLRGALTPLVATDAPPAAEVTLMRQPGRHMIHVVNYSAQRRATGHVEALDAPVPLRDITVTLRADVGIPADASAFLARTGEPLPIEKAENGNITVRIPRIDAYEIVVLEG